MPVNLYCYNGKVQLARTNIVRFFFYFKMEILITVLKGRSDLVATIIKSLMDLDIFPMEQDSK